MTKRLFYVTITNVRLTESSFDFSKRSFVEGSGRLGRTRNPLSLETPPPPVIVVRHPETNRLKAGVFFKKIPGTFSSWGGTRKGQESE